MSSDPSTNSIRWLHLTDLHAGQPKERDRYENIRDALFSDLRRLSEQQHWTFDVVFFSGDLAFSGAHPEYAEVDRRLGAILQELERLNLQEIERRKREGQQPSEQALPYLVPVPGNHDLVRPSKLVASTVRAAWAHSEEYREAFWRKGNEHLRDVVERAFEPYLAWFGRRPGLPPNQCVTAGLVPGDYQATFEVGGLRLGVVGLNTAFLHLGDDGQGELDARLEQLREVCGDYDRWAAEHHFRVLVTHHPADWLSPAGRAALASEIRHGERFDLHLYGHMHAGAHMAEAGVQGFRHSLQGRSLFGAEEEGFERMHGYSVGCFTMKADGYRRLEVFPREGHETSQGWHFGPLAATDPRTWSICAELGKAPSGAQDDPLERLEKEVGTKDELGTKLVVVKTAEDVASAGLDGRVILLSASIPSARVDPKRRRGEQPRVDTAQPAKIRQAIRALCRRAHDAGFRVLLGGHPSISEALLEVEETNEGAKGRWLYLFQHAHFGLRLPAATVALAKRPGVKLVIVEAPDGTPSMDASAVEQLREHMLASEAIVAGVFVGGMSGVEDEWTRFGARHEGKPTYAVGAGGGAAAELLGKHPERLRGGMSDSARLWRDADEAATAVIEDLARSSK